MSWWSILMLWLIINEIFILYRLEVYRLEAKD